MKGETVAAVVLWILIIIIVIVLIVWVSCECSKKNTVEAVVLRPPHKSGPAFGTHQAPEDAVAPDSQGSNWSDMEQPFSEAAQAAYHPYGASGGSAAPASAGNYPTEESDAARFPENPSPVDSVCAPAGSSSHGYSLDVEHLMPSGWRDTAGCGKEATDSTQWAAYAPSKQAFDNYNRTAGSARLSVNTRSSTARKIGLPNLVADAVRGCGAGGPPVPIGSDAVLFNDSDLRQNAIYNSVGQYPDIAKQWC